MFPQQLFEHVGVKPAVIPPADGRGDRLGLVPIQERQPDQPHAAALSERLRLAAGDRGRNQPALSGQAAGSHVR